MKKIAKSVALGLCLMLPVAATANGLGTCMTDSLTGKERKELAKWVYFAMATHPELTQFSTVSDKNREDTDKYIGALITRLLVEDCSQEMAAEMAVNPMAIEQAFQTVGAVAMQELMANQDVMQAISNYANYADLGAIGLAAQEK